MAQYVNITLALKPEEYKEVKRLTDNGLTIVGIFRAGVRFVKGNKNYVRKATL